jgi:hypothetical protein
VKGRAVGSPSKTAKGWFNSHYTLETNTEEVIVSQPILPQKMEQTSKDAVTFNAASSPATNSVLSTHTPVIYDNQPPPACDMLVHTPEDYTLTDSEAANSVMSQHSWSSIRENERTIDIYAMQLAVLTNQIGRLTNEIIHSNKKLLNEQKMNQKYKCEV